MKNFLLLTVLLLSANLVFAQVDKRLFNTRARAVIVLADNPINFLPGTDDLAGESKINLIKIVEGLKQSPDGTIIEISAHTTGSGNTPADLELTGKRAVTVRDALIRLGVNPKALRAKGYGNQKPIYKPDNSETGRRVNTRLEFFVTKESFGENFEVVPKNPSKPKEPVRTAEDEKVLRDLGNYEKMSPILERILKEGLNNKPGEQADKIVAGKGLSKVFIGATRTQIENALGEPETFIEGNMLLPDSSAFYYARGIVVVYDAQTDSVKSISFIGNPAYLDVGFYDGNFQTVAAKPDKNLGWGAGAAQIVAAYGEPKHKLIEKRKNAEVVTLTYDQITFTFNADKLYYIVVAASNKKFLDAMKKKADEQPEKDRYAAQLAAVAKSLDYKSQYTIVPGKGTNKIYLGASRTEIESAFGQPDEFVNEKAGIFSSYEAHYFSKGVQIEYDPNTKIATSILFFGDTAKTKSFGKYKLFPGVTDKEIRWGMSPADVMRVYGKPVEERMRYNPKLDKDYEFITYPNVAFGFAENRLVYIANDKIWGNKK